MRKFAVFAMDTYYPSGGMGDFKGSFNTREEAEIEGDNLRKYYDHIDIVDMDEFE